MGGRTRAWRGPPWSAPAPASTIAAPQATVIG